MTDWLRLLREALDEAHEDHDEGCDCYDRLFDGLDGVYRFPERSHGPPMAPAYGCKTLMEAVIEDMTGSLARAYFDTTINLHILGLDASLPPEAP